VSCTVKNILEHGYLRHARMIMGIISEGLAQAGRGRASGYFPSVQLFLLHVEKIPPTITRDASHGVL
jgi:hypothetical protein